MLKSTANIMLFTSFYLNNHSKPQTCKDKVFRFEVTLNPLAFVYISSKYSLQGTTQGRYLTGGVPPVRFSM